MSVVAGKLYFPKWEPSTRNFTKNEVQTLSAVDYYRDIKVV